MYIYIDNFSLLNDRIRIPDESYYSHSEMRFYMHSTKSMYILYTFIIQSKKIYQ